jgi:hypothetical protein
MVTLNTGASSSVALNVFSKSPPSPTNLTSSFAEQLATSLEAFLNGGGNSSHFEIDVDAAQSQDSGVRQFIVTLRDPTVGLHAPTAPGDPSTAAPNAAAPLIGVQPAPVQPVAAPFVNPVMQMMGGSPSDTYGGRRVLVRAAS